jgi:hypothetical protein
MSRNSVVEMRPEILCALATVRKPWLKDSATKSGNEPWHSHTDVESLLADLSLPLVTSPAARRR